MYICCSCPLPQWVSTSRLRSIQAKLPSCGPCLLEAGPEVSRNNFFFLPSHPSFIQNKKPQVWVWISCLKGVGGWCLRICGALYWNRSNFFFNICPIAAVCQNVCTISAHIPTESNLLHQIVSRYNSGSLNEMLYECICLQITSRLQFLQIQIQNPEIDWQVIN